MYKLYLIKPGTLSAGCMRKSEGTFFKSERKKQKKFTYLQHLGSKKQELAYIQTL